MNSLIKSLLDPLGYPVSPGTNNNADETYIVFNEYNQASALNADDKEMFTKYFYQVDIFSSGNYLQLVKDVKRVMKAAGFGRMFESETYDTEMGKYRKIIRFSYISEEE